MSFIYDLVKTFYFPIKKEKKKKKNYKADGIKRIFPDYMLTNTGSTSIMFQIICNFENNVPDDKFRDVIFEFIVENEFYDTFDTSHKYWEKFKARKIELEKRLGYFKLKVSTILVKSLSQLILKNITNTLKISLATKNINVKKGTPGMNFENFVK